MSGKRKIIFKIEITLLVFLATLFALTLAFTDDHAESPATVGDTVQPVETVPLPSVSDTPEPPEITDSDDAPTDAPNPDEPKTSPKDTYNDRYFTLGLDEYNMGIGDLILVNSENYFEIPENNKLVLVAENKSRSYVLLDGNARLAEKIMKPLNAMMDDFNAATGIKNVLLNSTFRTPEKQQAVFNDWVKRVGAEEAERMASAPGYSEHHTGLAFDIAIYSSDVVSTFKGTGKYAWIHENAFKYGFVLRYPEDKQEITGTAYEPWHFRYIGVPHAFFMTRRGYAFEEYMEYLMNFRFSDMHLFDVYEGVLYEIYYVRGEKVPVPKDFEYAISGNNIDGFIITVKIKEIGEAANND